MPASSLSGLNSWAAYLFASVALVLLLAPGLGGVARDSRASADWRNLDGARAVIDSLRPGVTVAFSYGASRVSDPLRLLGHQVSCSDGNGTIAMPVRWVLPNTTLFPAVYYRLSLAQEKVEVSLGV